jgi:thioredoxin-like negative regulator of GroEL
MTGLAATVLLQAALLTTGAQSYEEAFKEHEESGKPLLVMVGADWCPACVSMKSGTLAKMERSGKLKGVAFSMLNLDRQERVARKMMNGGTVPQLILYTKTDKGWNKQQLVGPQSEQEVQRFIGSAVEKHIKVTATSTETSSTVQ